MRDDEASVLDMVTAGRLALAYVAGMSKSQFDHDTKTQDAALRRLTILGEAARRVGADYQTKHQDIDWSGLIRMRDKVTHGYDVVDLDIVWGVLQQDLPAVLTALERLVPER